MKILPFLALFAVLIFASSYVSTKLDAATQAAVNDGAFKQFRLQRAGTDVSLKWAVSARNVVAFAVERSYDGAHFETIGSLHCKGTAFYTYNDIDVTPGKVYYRVAAVHTDDSVESSGVAATQVGGHS